MTAAAVTTDTVPKLSLWDGELRSRRQASATAMHTRKLNSILSTADAMFAAGVACLCRLSCTG